MLYSLSMVANMSLGDLCGRIGVRQGHIDLDGVLLAVVAGQVEGVVGAGHDLGGDVVDGEGSGVDAQLGVDVVDL